MVLVKAARQTTLTSSINKPSDALVCNPNVPTAACNGITGTYLVLPSQTPAASVTKAHVGGKNGTWQLKSSPDL
jgi:hypothetical protein